MFNRYLIRESFSLNYILKFNLIINNNFRSMKKLSFFFSSFLFLCMMNILAKDTTDFKYINFGVDGIYNIHKTELDNYWEAGAAIDFSASTPYFSGLLELGVSYSPFTASVEELPDFKSFHIYLQWQKEFRIYKNLKILTGPRVGMMQMKFDKTEEINNATDLLEHEVTAGLASQLVQKISDRLNINLTANYFRVFTRKKIDLFYIGAGLSYSIDTPVWLKNFLQ